MSRTAGPDAPADSVSPHPPAVALLASRLMGRVAHDLRTPIMVIRGYLKMMLDGRTGAITDEQQECLRVTLESVQRLVDIAAASARGSEILPRVQGDFLNIQELWQRVKEKVQPGLAEKGITIKEKLSSLTLLVCGDNQMIEALLRSIVSRAASLMARDKDLIVEFTSHHSGDIVMTLLAGADANAVDAVRVVPDMQTEVFLIGGKLSLDTSAESGLSFRLSLPGSDA